MSVSELNTKFVTISGKRIRYIKEGQGQPLILLHGLGRSIHQWKDHISEFSQHFTVYAFDFPGFGHSQPLRPHELNISLPPMFIEQFRQAFNIEKPIILGGSFGGLAALDYALEFPQNVKKLIIMDSAGLGKDINLVYRLITLPLLGEFWKLMDYRGLDHDHRFLWKTTKLPRIGDLLEKMFTPPDPERLEHTLELNRGTSLKLIRYAISIFGQKKVIRRNHILKNIKTPTLILWIKGDPIFPLKDAESAHKLIKNSTLHVLDDKNIDPGNWSARHWPPLAFFEEFNKLVIEFSIQD